MASIKERAAALKLADKLCVRPTSRKVNKPIHDCLLWNSLIIHLKSTVPIKRRRVHVKAHSDCFLGSEAVDVVAKHLKLTKKFEEFDVTRDKVVCVCQALLDCNVFEVPGTKTQGNGKKLMFQDSKNAFYRFIGATLPSVDELERGVLAAGIEAFFSSEKLEERATPTTSHVERLVGSVIDSMTAGTSIDSPKRSQTEGKLPQPLVDEVWQELTLLRLLNLVELPVLEGILHCSPSPRSSQRTHQWPTNNLDLTHLDRGVLKAFRDSQEDEWLCAALDCLDFLPEQSVADISRKLPHCFSEWEMQKPTYEQPLLCSSDLDNYKLLIYGALSKNYSLTDRVPLLPEHLSEIYKAISELLLTAKFDTALEALQLCLKLLPPSDREELRRLLTFMALAAEPQAIKLETEVENRVAIKRSFSRAILHSKCLTKEKADLMLVFMLSNIQDIFKIPGALHKEVSDKLVLLEQGEQTDVTGSTFCQHVPKRTYVDSAKTTTNNELWKLLESIHLNTQISGKERKRLLGQFYQAHPEVFSQYFGDSAANVL